ncbi:hypothetical protein B0A55_13463 [Friedmanniomyces simplex]|uniref:Uncharacterized protein n=1 Tax=Friedmanniomyces simplex TaxID=329884 RepID=A0A4U0VMZ6_9PEZI|nr:hypothetical protein B0A55_13463 [Friedmanniomyces simplex]
MVETEPSVFVVTASEVTVEEPVREVGLVFEDAVDEEVAESLAVDAEDGAEEDEGVVLESLSEEEVCCWLEPPGVDGNPQEVEAGELPDTGEATGVGDGTLVMDAYEVPWGSRK